MISTMLITGATDGIGLAVAERLAAGGRHLLLHGRNPDKLAAAERAVRSAAADSGSVIDTLVADLSHLDEVDALAADVLERCDHLDALINNAGVFRTSQPITDDGFDVRFVVNTIAPYLLTRRLEPVLGPSSRVVNLSSAAQAPVDLRALAGQVRLPDEMAAYAQSKLAITMWSRQLADEWADAGPVVIAVNPGSLLATKMVKEGFGVAGNDIAIGADVVARAALADEFAPASGRYFDNDAGRFADPHPDALDPAKNDALVQAVESIIAGLGRP